MLRDLFNWLPSRRRRAREHAEAEAEVATTALREEVVEAETREAYRLAHRLAEHRRESHFEQRMRAAYRGEKHA